MKNRTIGIIGMHDDPDVELLKSRIEDLGARARIINFWHLPRFATLMITADSIVYDGINLMELDAFYLRQVGYFSPLPEKPLSREEWEEYYEKFNEHLANERENLSLREAAVRILSDVKPVINPYWTAFFHKIKVHQYHLLASKGLPVPKFVAGNDFGTCKDFLSENPSILKPLVGGYVKAYDAQTLEAERENLRKKPILIQQRIKGKMLRSFVIDNRVIGTCELVHTDEHVDSRVDIVEIRNFDLPESEQRIAIEATRALGMIFAGVDLILEEDSGKIYVLESNPAPLFRNFEAQAGVPVSQELADFLVNEA